jgi:hypothetical protein
MIVIEVVGLDGSLIDGKAGGTTVSWQDER